jgi:hypothetical protein
MALQDVVKEIRSLLAGLTIDIEKAANGNKAASQRVRTGTIKLEKAAKRYRKESIKAEKSGAFRKPAAKKAAKAKPAKKAKAKPAPAKHAPAKHAPAKHVGKKR